MFNWLQQTQNPNTLVLPDSKTPKLLLIGATGNGKSSFGNALLQDYSKDYSKEHSKPFAMSRGVNTSIYAHFENEHELQN